MLKLTAVTQRFGARTVLNEISLEVAAGYVRRRPDPAHGRRILLTLSPKGERAYSAIASAARRRHKNLLDALSPAERALLERALAKLQARASAMLAAPELGFGR